MFSTKAASARVPCLSATFQRESVMIKKSQVFARNCGFSLMKMFAFPFETVVFFPRLWTLCCSYLYTNAESFTPFYRPSFRASIPYFR